MAIQTTITCVNKSCKSENIVRFGKQLNGTQRYQCKDCSKTFSLNTRKTFDADFRLMVVNVHITTGKSYREIGQIFNISHQSVKNWVESHNTDKTA